MIKRLAARRLTVFALLAACLVVPGGDCLGKQQHDRTEGGRNSLEIFLRDYVKGPDYDYKATRYVAAFADLRDDGIKQAIVYFTDKNSCGSGGCSTLVLDPEGSSYRIVTSITIVRRPIRVLGTKSNGWHDIGVGVGGGGIQLGYEALLSFDGKTYPSNPTVPPARHLSEKVPGEIVIASSAIDKPLFP